MKDFEKTESQAREKYEPMEIKVLTVTPQGVLCQSGGGGGLLMKALGKGGAI